MGIKTNQNFEKGILISKKGPVEILISGFLQGGAPKTRKAEKPNLMKIPVLRP